MRCDYGLATTYALRRYYNEAPIDKICYRSCFIKSNIHDCFETANVRRGHDLALFALVARIQGQSRDQIYDGRQFLKLVASSREIYRIAAHCR